MKRYAAPMPVAWRLMASVLVSLVLSAGLPLRQPAGVQAATPPPDALTPPSIDLYLLLDLTGSFAWPIEALKDEVSGVLIPGLLYNFPNSRIGLGAFEDYPIEPFGLPYAGDQAYYRALQLTDRANDILAAVTGLSVVTGSGADQPESQLPALYQAATGAGQDLSGVGYPGASIAPGQQADFRDGVVKLMVVWTDAPFHRPGDHYTGTIPYPGPSFTDTVNAVLDRDQPLVLGVSLDGGGLADLQAVASATGAVAPDGGVDCNRDTIAEILSREPLVCTIPSDGTGISNAILALAGAASRLPIADAGGPYAAHLGHAVSFDAGGSYDPDGTIVYYEWDFESDNDIDFSSSEPTAAFVYPAEFSGLATLRVTDADNNQRTDTAPVTVSESIFHKVYLPLVLRRPL